MVFRSFKEPRVVNGFTDMGRPRIPPVPTGIVFTDRDDGTEYLLSHSGGTYTLTSVPGQFHGKPWGPYDGPTLTSPAGLLRLYVASGTLSYELAPEAMAGRRDQRILTRDFSDNATLFELTAPDGWTFGDPLTVTQVLPEE